MFVGPFKDRIIIITGAASGIGRALSEELAHRGARLVMVDRNGKLLKEAAEAIAKAGGKAWIRELDVRDYAAVHRLVAEVLSGHGRLDYLFNNAGIGVLGEARDVDYDDWRRVIDTDLYGVVNGVAAAYPAMVRQGFGHIVNTSSLAGLIPIPGEISYTASKYAVVGLSNALRIEGEDLGVKVSVVCPGLIDTPILRTSKMLKVDPERAAKELPKPISPERCARIILRGVEKNRAMILVTGLARFAWILQRISPAIAASLLKQKLKILRAFRVDN
ncbi:MAG: SDR family oxidoreductase [Deltaproteobacteria bacterium]|nr:SDR family oxidoreductase [Deltaproteobacteria bacterium]